MMMMIDEFQEVGNNKDQKYKYSGGFFFLVYLSNFILDINTLRVFFIYDI